MCPFPSKQSSRLKLPHLREEEVGQKFLLSFDQRDWCLELVSGRACTGPHVGPALPPTRGLKEDSDLGVNRVCADVYPSPIPAFPKFP